MKFSYFPGCTLKTKARDLDKWGRESALKLGVELREIEEWQCCGAVYPQVEDEIASRLSSVRALMDARAHGEDLLTLCSACHHVIKRMNHDMKENEYVRTRVNNYLKPDVPYAGETKVVHYLEMLRDTVGFDEIKKQVVNPLKGRKIGAYYGCLLLRPSAVMAFDNPEHPTIIEDFLSAIGATSVKVPQRVLRRLHRAGGSRAGREAGRARPVQRRRPRLRGAGHRLPAVHVQPEAERGRARASGLLFHRAAG